MNRERWNMNSPCIKYNKMHTSKWLVTILVLNEQHMLITITGSF